MANSDDRRAAERGHSGKDVIDEEFPAVVDTGRGLRQTVATQINAIEVGDVCQLLGQRGKDSTVQANAM
jgi:hypothetical protein